MPWWLIASEGVKLGLDLFGQSKEKRAQKELSQIQQQQSQLQGAETIRRLEQERGNTLSQLTARAGRAGAEVGSTESVTSGAPASKTSVMITPRNIKTIKSAEVAGTQETSGQGSVLIQQQRIADLYEQEILYSKKQQNLAEKGQEVQTDFMRQSSNLDTIGSILEAGSSMFSSWYSFNQTKVPSFYDPNYKTGLGRYY